MMRIFPFPPGIKFTHPYHNYYGSSFYRFMQLELLICTSTSIFKHFLYTNMPYICNAKIGCNFITLSFQHTQLQHFCLEIPQQLAEYSTSFSHMQALYEALIRQDELLAYIDRQQTVKFCVSYGCS